MNRQIKLVKNYASVEFENEISSIEKQNVKLLTDLKVDLSIRSAYLFGTINKDLGGLTDTFFINKFKSVS
jgi:hypothetical protein